MSQQQRGRRFTVTQEPSLIAARLLDRLDTAQVQEVIRLLDRSCGAPEQRSSEHRRVSTEGRGVDEKQRLLEGSR